MPTLKVYAHGVSMGQPGNNLTPSARGVVSGWSSASLRRNRAFLYSVDVDALQAHPGVAFTLTLRDCPPSAAEWTTARDTFLDALRHEGFAFIHWVTEWQRRRVPHLHLAVFLPPGSDPAVFAGNALRHWLRVAAPYRPSAHAQHVTPIYDALGWNQYLAKHAARGLSHYQRSRASLPEAWQGSSVGRMWGKRGDWPVIPPMDLTINPRAFAILRRILRSWRVSDARTAIRTARRPQDLLSAIRRLKSARRMLTCPDPGLSRVRGCSEWFPQELTYRVLALVADLGGIIES